LSKEINIKTPIFSQKNLKSNRLFSGKILLKSVLLSKIAQTADMNHRFEKQLNAVRDLEKRLTYASPDEAAALTVKLVRMKGKLFQNSNSSNR
jgi:hypothetical protein